MSLVLLTERLSCVFVVSSAAQANGETNEQITHENMINIDVNALSTDGKTRRIFD
jgi:hypothetical protein